VQQLGGRRRAAAVETRDDQLVAQKPTSSSAWSRWALYKFKPATAYCRPERRSIYPGAAWPYGRRDLRSRRSGLRAGGIRDAAHLSAVGEGRIVQVLRPRRPELHRDGASTAHVGEHGAVE